MEHRLHSRVGIAIIVVASIFLLTAGAALAAGAAKSEPARLPAPTGGWNMATFVTSDTISPTLPVTGGVMIPTCIGLFFGVPVSEVMDIRSDGLGWGGVAKAYFLAQDSGLTVQAIAEMKQGDMGWGEIAQYLGLPPGNHGRNLGLIISGRGAPTDTVSTRAQRLADRLGADAEDIAEMLNQEGATYGTVIVAHKLASKFPGLKTAGDLVDERVEGASWGQIRRGLKASASTTASGLSTPGGGKANGHGKDGKQGQGNQGQGHGQGRGHDKKGRGGGKKH